MRRRLIKQPTYGTCCHQSTLALSSTLQSVPMHKFRSATVQTAPLHRNHSAPRARKTTDIPPIFFLLVCLPDLSMVQAVVTHSHTAIESRYVPDQLCKICGLKFGPWIGFIIRNSVFPYQHHSAIGL